jgi:hypothetical protein
VSGFAVVIRMTAKHPVRTQERLAATPAPFDGVTWEERSIFQPPPDLDEV